jgi:hypothetical protein
VKCLFYSIACARAVEEYVFSIASLVKPRDKSWLWPGSVSNLGEQQQQVKPNPSSNVA